MAFFDEFEHLKIQLDEIRSATNNFADSNVIGVGGFGKVYKGEISHSKGRSLVAFKRLDDRLGQGNCEFWKEIMMLSRYTHENLVSLVGYCDDGGEKILVYEHASRGSLDRYLSSTALTWIQRLKICLGVARGLCYLHDPMGTQQRIIHRDIKSSNILLDEKWNAKVSDMGLSKIGHANQQHTVIVSNVVGTLGYLDPLYLEKGMLTKESDVYSFGVVLFEALCGRLCYEYSNRQYQILVPLWKQSYEENKIADIIFPSLKQEMNFISLGTFLEIAYLCLLNSREERPSMDHVVEKLEIALQFQEIYEVMEVPREYEAIFKFAMIPPVFKSKEELKRLLSKGVLANRGKTWFSLNENEEHCELISARGCLNPSADEYCSEENSRFVECCYRAEKMIFGVHVRARFLSPGIPYKVNLVFKAFTESYPLLEVQGFGLKYQIQGETKSSFSCLAYEREDGWMTFELYQFISNGTDFDLDIRFEGNMVRQTRKTVIEGIEFRPLKKVEHETLEDKEDMQPISDSDSDVDWIQKLPNDYKQIIKRSKDTTKWTTKKELYTLFCKGFLIHNRKGFPFINKREEWFSLNKNGKKCLMLSARASLVKSEWTWIPLPESRFKEVAINPSRDFSIIYDIKSNILSPQTTYACYLVYKITKNHSAFEVPFEVLEQQSFNRIRLGFIYLPSPQTRVISAKDDQNTYNPPEIPKLKGLPRLRNDGWMEVQVWEFQTDTTSKMTLMNLDVMCLFHHPTTLLHGLTVQGVELKPL